MRRPPIDCRRAVQSLQPPAAQHIWISDELLSSTLQRFFRGSCPQQKRHGSHVPGPLEARRRAAKRRMTVSANFYPQDNFPPSFNLGALFGFRSNPQPSWRYEPPSLQKDAEPLQSVWDPETSAPSPQPSKPMANSSSPNPSSRDNAYSFSQSIPHLLEEKESALRSAVKQNESARPNVVEKNMQVANATAFRTRIAGTIELALEERNVVISKAFQECCPASPDTSVYNAMVIRHIVELGCDPTPVLERCSTSEFAVPSMHSPGTFRLLVDLEKLLERYPHCVRQIQQVHIKLAESVVSTKYSKSKYHEKKLVMLVRQMWQTAHLQSARPDSSVIKLLCSVAKRFKSPVRRDTLVALLSSTTKAEHCITALIANVDKDPSLLTVAADILSCLPNERLLGWVPTITLGFAQATSSEAWYPGAKFQCRMHIWLQLLRHMDADLAPSSRSLLDEAIAPLGKYTFSHRGEIRARIQVLLSALVVKAFQTGDLLSDSVSKISHLLCSFETAMGQSGPISVDATFGILLSQLQKKDLPHEPLVEMLLDSVVRHAGIKPTVDFLRILDQRKLTLADATPLHQLVAKQVATIRSSSKATESERQHNAFALQTCQMILDILSRISSTPTPTLLMPELNTLQAQRQFAHILTRAQIDHALPLAYRNVTANMSAEKCVDLIHQLAHQYSTDKTRTHREAWRAMYYLYRYLLAYSLPIGPLFSKAVVRTSIIRPMSENRFVSSRRMVWVCHLVARVEGEAVAKQIEANMFIWRGSLIHHAKNVYVGVGGDRRDKAHVNTMKRLGLI